MGQVPTHHYLLIGSGALARHFHFYFTSLKSDLFELSTWNRQKDSFKDLKLKLNQATHVLLAISDSAIEDFFKTHHEWGMQAQWIHFSGANHFKNLISFHPLMSFGPDLYDLETYKKIHFVLTGVHSLAEAFPFLENSFTALPAEKKSLYHSLCVLGGNLPILLWKKMSEGFTQMGLPEEAGHIYLETVLKNYLVHREKALTGPLQRKDLITIKKNLDALEDDSFQKIYSAFAEAQNINPRDL